MLAVGHPVGWEANRRDVSESALGGQAHHGYPANNFGLRQYLEADPAGATAVFSLDQSGNTTGGDWRKVYSGNATYKENSAAGTAFIVIRRSDAKGLQLSKLV